MLIKDGEFPQTIPEFLRNRVEHSPNSIACYHLVEEREWVPTTWSEYFEKVQQFAAALEKLGLSKGDRLGIMIPTCREWEFTEKAALSLGAIVVGIEPHAPQEHKELIIGEAALTALFITNDKDIELLDETIVNTLKFIVTLEDNTPGINTNGKLTRVLEWRNIPAGVKTRGENEPSGSDPATLIFTSGTTGTPKGILYTHRQCILACQSLLEIFGNFTATDNVICWMPLANLFQRIMNLCAVGTASPVYFVEDPSQVMEHICTVKPSVFIGVPRFYEKLWNGILLQIETMPVLKRVPASMALNIARQSAGPSRKNEPLSLLQRLSLRAADVLVLRKLRDVMGGKIQYMISGSAPCQMEVLEFFEAIGLPVLEAYGVSENIVPVSANRPDDYRLGSVGKVLSLNEVEIADDGEVMVKGEGLFPGYYKSAHPDESFTADGFYATSDFGHIDDDGFLYLKGRKSEIIKTSTGRRIALNRVENVLRQIALIDQVVVIGSGRKALIAIVTLDDAKQGNKLESEQENAEKLASLANEIHVRGKALAPYERVVACLVPDEPFTIDGGELTPNLKIRRSVIEDKYREDVDRLYREVELSRQATSDIAEEVPVILCPEK